MKEIFLVSKENKSKAEDLLKKDDLVGRGSITVRSASSLDIKDKKIKGTDYFIILDASEEAIKKAEELLKELAKKYDKKENVLKKFDEQENSAIEGFGAIVG
jgi:hypothetical protein